MADISPNKRARTNAESVLARPFKSPFRRSVPSASSSDLPSAEVGTEPTTNDAIPSTPTPYIVDKKPLSRAFRLNSKRQLLDDPEMKELQKEKCKLDALLRKTQEDLDMAKQALQIRSSNKVAELQEEIVKWRRIAQNVADEVFENAQQRVSNMGGIAAWNKQSKFNGEQPNPEYAEQDIKASEEAEDEEFNMGYMLKTLNIDPKAIGYDVAGDKWIRD